MIRARCLPDDDPGCGWWALLPPPEPARPLQGDQRADCAVVGAGFTGLAVARRLAERRPHWRIVLLEAQRVGFGTSGRNSGFVGDLAHRDPEAEADETLRLKRVAQAGVALLRGLVREHGIECQWSEAGRLHAAVTDRSLRSLDHLRRLLERFGEAHRPLDAAACATFLGTGYYRAALQVPATVLVQPAALVRGVAAALPQNVELFEESPVRAIGRARRFELETGAGRLTSERVVVATNGFAPALGLLARRVFPLFTYASLTRPLGADEQAALGGEREWGLVPEDRMGTSLRRTPDQRLLVRNTVRYRRDLCSDALTRATVRALHSRSLRARFPALERVELEHTWGGVLGMTRNQGQCFGRIADGLFAWAGCNGSGVALGTGAGLALADLVVGADSDLLSDALALRPPGWIPPDPLLGWGVAAYTRYLQRRAGPER